MTTDRTVAAAVHPLLHDAASWRLIGLLFECPAPGWLDRVAALGRECQDAQLRSAAEAAQAEASEGLHHSLFGPGGPVSPREVTYVGGVQHGYLLSEVRAFYSAFAYAPKTIEPEDHLSVEVGFIAYLAMKRAYAIVAADEDAAAVAAEASTNFCTGHLANMVEPIARALELGGPPYLALAARALLERVGPAPRHRLPIVDCAETPDAEDDACGAGGPARG